MKKILSYALIAFMVVGLFMFPNYEVQAANVSLGVSASKVSIGDSVKVTVAVPDGMTATVDLKDWSNILSFSSSSVDVGSNGGTITINVGKMSVAGSNSVTLTFKAKSSGTANIKASVISAVDNNTVEDVALGGASTQVTVENKVVDSGNGGTTTEPKKSEDNSLSSLKLSSGTLSPSFKHNVTKYTATVGYDVTKVVVSAKTSNAKAVIESVTGDGTVNLKVGENTIKVVVRAENGVKATYTIVVTRQVQGETAPQPSESQSESETPIVNEMLQWNGEQLQAVENIPVEQIPANFETTLLVVNGQQMPGLSFNKGDLKLLYLNNTNNAGSFYVFDEVQQTIYPFIKLVSEKSYIMILLPDEQNAPAPEGVESCTFSIEGKGIVSGYQFAPETFYAAEPKVSDFYLIYAMNAEGEKGWYLYDSVEETYQRYMADALSLQTGAEAGTDLESKYLALQKELNTAKLIQYIIIAAAVVVIIILIIVIVVLAAKNRKKDEDEFEEEFEEEFDEEFEEDEYDEEELEEVDEEFDDEEVDDGFEFIDFE